VAQSTGRIVEAEPRLIDWSTLETRYTQGLVEKVAHTTLATHAGTPVKLREKAQCRDVAAVHFLAHMVKSLAGNLEALRVHELARETESAARAERDDAVELAMRLADALDEVLVEIADRYPPAGAITRAAASVGMA
jgi:HPt (histidine-containing phosphotransfer) domain-containing protein